MGLWKSVRYQPFILDLLVGNMLELLRGSECDVWHSAVRGSVDLLGYSGVVVPMMLNANSCSTIGNGKIMVEDKPNLT
jgi:hypothetical protein